MAICSAHTTSGKPCKAQAILGATVCRVHGGSAPQVRRAAQVRLMMAADPAAAGLIRQMNDKSLDEGLRQKAYFGILDRAGLGTTSKMEHTGANGGPIKTLELSAYPLELLETVEKALAAGVEAQGESSSEGNYLLD